MTYIEYLSGDFVWSDTLRRLFGEQDFQDIWEMQAKTHPGDDNTALSIINQWLYTQPGLAERRKSYEQETKR